jgi:hypothetical protein
MINYNNNDNNNNDNNNNNSQNAYIDALYESRYKNKLSGVFSMLAILSILGAIIGLLIFRNDKNIPEDLVRRATVICSVIIALALLAEVLLTKLYNLAENKRIVCFAVYPSYILISKKLKSKDPLEKILHSQISEYMFVNDISTSSSADLHEVSTIANTIHHRLNSGTLIVLAQGIKYKTNIEDIAAAQKILQKLIPIPETYNNDW